MVPVPESSVRLNFMNLMFDSGGLLSCIGYLNSEHVEMSMITFRSTSTFVI